MKCAYRGVPNEDNFLEFFELCQWFSGMARKYPGTMENKNKIQFFTIIIFKYTDYLAVLSVKHFLIFPPYNYHHSNDVIINPINLVSL